VTKNFIQITRVYEQKIHTHAFKSSHIAYYVALDVAGSPAKLRISQATYRKLKRGCVPAAR
jgi:hypothetical protein